MRNRKLAFENLEGRALLAAEPILLADINQALYPGNGGDTSMIAQIGNHILFAASTRTTGKSLWTSDGTEEGTYILSFVTPIPEADGFINAGNLVYFRGSDSVLGEALWKSDGTPEGTVLVADIAPGFTNPRFSSFKLHDRSDVVFRGKPESAGKRLVAI
jgi:ELWxxDGT repeat protein